MSLRGDVLRQDVFPDCLFQAADVDGEINLSTCFDITDYPTQKNCGFKIHVSFSNFLYLLDIFGN